MQHLSKEEFLALQNLCKNKNIVIQKSGKGNSVVVVDKTDYLDKMENLLNDTQKFEKINLKNDGILTNFDPSTWKSQKSALYGLLLTKVYNVWARKVERSYVWWHWILMQNLKENWLVLSKMT